jgi:hypothetical protein
MAIIVMGVSMIATLLGICAALALAVGIRTVPGFEAELLLPEMLFEFFFSSALFFSSLPWVWTLFLTLGAETNPVSASALQSNMKDRRMYLYSTGVIISSFIGIIIVNQPLVPVGWCLGVSIILIGITLDFLRMAYFRLQYRRSPEGIADWLIETMKGAVKRPDEKFHTMSFEAVFTLIIAYLKNGEMGAFRLFCQKIVIASDLWLGSIARVSLFRIPSENEETLLDRYSLAEAMTAKRLAWVIREACDIGGPTALEEAVRLAGRLFLTFHGYHPSLGFLLLVTLSQISQKTQGKIEPWDRDVELMSAFSEVVKALIDKSIERKIPDTASITKVLAILETHVKESFRREKSVNPAFLMQPFAEIGQMLASPYYTALPDRDEIIAVLRRILAQFAALETVTGRLEISGEGTDTKASFHEDLPFTRPRVEAEEPPQT